MTAPAQIDLTPDGPDEAISVIESLFSIRNDIHEYLAQAHAQSAPVEPQHLADPPGTKALMVAFTEVENSGEDNLYQMMVRSCVREARAALMVRRVARELSILADVIADTGVLGPVEMDTMARQVQHLSGSIGSARDATGEIGIACASDVGVARAHVGRLRDRHVECELVGGGESVRAARGFVGEMLRRLTLLEKAGFVGHTRS